MLTLDGEWVPPEGRLPFTSIVTPFLRFGSMMGVLPMSRTLVAVPSSPPTVSCITSSEGKETLLLHLQHEDLYSVVLKL